MIRSTFKDVFLGLPLGRRSFKLYPQWYFTIIPLTVDLPIDNSEEISREDFPFKRKKFHEKILLLSNEFGFVSVKPCLYSHDLL